MYVTSLLHINYIHFIYTYFKCAIFINPVMQWQQTIGLCVFTSLVSIVIVLSLLHFSGCHRVFMSKFTCEIGIRSYFRLTTITIALFGIWELGIYGIVTFLLSNQSSTYYFELLAVPISLFRNIQQFPWTIVLSLVY